MLDPESAYVTPPVLLGPEFTSSTQLVAPISSLWDVPILTYAASSPYLTANDDYVSVWRTCINDAVQVQAWADLCIKFSWKHVVILVESSSYSAAATEYFIAAANRAGILVTKIQVDDGQSKANLRIREAMEKVRNSGIKIIFAPILTLAKEVLDTAIEERMFGAPSFVRREKETIITVKKWYPDSEVKANATYTIKLPKNVRNDDFRVQGYVWNLVDSIAGIMNVKYASVVEGALAFNEPNAQVLAEFNQTRYRHFLDEAYNHVCSLYATTENSISTSSLQSANLTSSELFSGELMVSTLSSANRTLLENAKDALFSSYSMALARAIILICDICDAYYTDFGSFPNATTMVSRMKDYKKENSFGVTFSFNGRREWTDVELILINARNGDYMHEIGRWSNITGFQGIKEELMVWGDGSNHVPDDGIALEHYVFFGNPISIVIYILTAVLALSLGLTAVGLVKYWSTPVFRLATPELLAIMLGGLFLLGTSVIGHIGRPAPFLCALRTWPYYVGLSLIYAPLIVKTYRVYIIFESVDQMRPRSFSTNRVLVLTLVLVLIPIILATVRIIVSPPSGFRSLSYDGQRVEVKCLVKFSGLVWSQLAVATTQMLISAYLAWNTRNVPDGFNETRYVFGSTYATSVIGPLGFMVSYFIEPSNAALAACFLALSSLLSAFTCWILLFLPKLHLAFFRPERNCLDLIKNHSSRTMTLQELPLSEINAPDERNQYEAPTILRRHEKG